MKWTKQMREAQSKRIKAARAAMRDGAATRDTMTPEARLQAAFRSAIKTYIAEVI